MQAIVTYLLLAVLAASVVTFTVLGIAMRRGARRLETFALENGMRFSAADLFDVTRRYRKFTLVAGGHSAYAHNVTHGWLAGWPVRAFDFRYEVGHGPRRQTRRYGVVAIETDLELPDAVLWNEADVASAPLTALLGEGTVACWSYRGDDHLARVMGDAAVSLAGLRSSLEARDGVVMIAKPLEGRQDPYSDLLTRAEELAAALRRSFAPEPRQP